MVWYHGGAYMSGESSLGLYNGERLAKERDVVVVTVNYRLGALGFLYFSDLAKAAGLADDFIDNPGMRDQIAALKWIHDNISAFGGDPGNVTIFGESAGGSTIITLLCAPAAKGLFHRAITESGAPSCIYGRETGSLYAAKFLELLGLKPEDVGKLRDMPVEKLAGATEKIMDWNAINRPRINFFRADYRNRDHAARPADSSIDRCDRKCSDDHRDESRRSDAFQGRCAHSPPPRHYS